MKNLRSCSLRHASRRLTRWAILVFPLCLTGCFESQSATNRAARGKTGISLISRFFNPSQTTLGEVQLEAASANESQAFLRARAAGDWVFAREDMEDLDIALPDMVGFDREASAILKSGQLPSMASLRGANARNAGLGAKSLLFSKSFDQLFANVFNQGAADALAADDFVNPFTEARQKQTLTADADEPKTETDAADTKKEAEEKEKPKEAKRASNDTTTGTPGGGIPLTSERNPFLIIGDFDGSGTLRAVTAGRSGKSVFLSDDGERDFNLFINTDAVGSERSFYIDDLNFDGNGDLLVVSHSSLFGAVLLGDGSGGYRVVDKFLTGYEPTVPSAGPAYNGSLQILTVNTRSGVITTFGLSDRYRMLQTEELSFSPNYLLHMVGADNSRNFLRAAHTSGIEQILGWGEDNLLRHTSDRLGADPMVLSGAFGSGSVQVFQVGKYASMMLSSQGKAFNVANLRMLPSTYLMLGDFYGRGTLDVAVARLLSFIPKQ